MVHAGFQARLNTCGTVGLSHRCLKYMWAYQAELSRKRKPNKKVTASELRDLEEVMARLKINMICCLASYSSIL